MAEIWVNSEKKFYAEKGENLLESLRKNGIYADAPCSGKGICKKCRAIYRGKEILLCRTVIEDDMEIEIPKEKQAENICLSDKDYAAVIDIGTTTIKIVLFDLQSRKAVYSSSYMNRQKSFGADVVSRVEYAEKNGVQALYDTVKNQIEEVICTIFKRSGVSIKKLRKFVVSGNTVMEHIFCKESLNGFCAYPFKPEFLESRIIKAEKLGYCFEAEVIIMPCASAFIGGDIVGGMAECFKENENSIFIDIGTNAEMALFYNGKIYTASASAGPAFEGGKIKYGTGCVDGAINHIKLINGMVSVETINKKESVGICGSGLVDICAEFLRNDIIDKSGRFLENNKYRRYFGNDGFRISRNITINQNDIREIQLAKSAIYSGIKSLVYDKEEIDTMYLCGGMGEYIDEENAEYIKLLPKMKIKRMGNTSIKGGELVLFENKLEYCDNLAKSCKDIQLSDSEYFKNEFIKNMDF